MGIQMRSAVRQFRGSVVLRSREQSNYRTLGTHGTAVRSQADRHGVGAPNAFQNQYPWRRCRTRSNTNRKTFLPSGR
jgi:hypothetical protein